ncbi:hypothetical protein B4589_017875 (plasmid) [Halolamina sp. CBA1230]|uniref:hypothetical protein n=1 Tax=Halolamina sp. CBA1230 TaxID=1853690 RepID=UPI0009A1D37A|nr:hypothetical protein [Halolamina sp. CBA1230]QKY22265.1 hypothetical protein B4589_017875 [Halolamina sp. CBA1230]
MVLEQVAFDIETTGFAVDDAVTVVGFAVPAGLRVFVQTSDRSASDIESAVAAVTPAETLVNVSTHMSEQDLLTAVAAFVADRLAGDDVLLVAYNGERWNGGFDVPFLRTRYAQQGQEWPFVDVPYADLMPIVADRFNTTVRSGGGDGDDGGDGGDGDAAATRERNDLGHAYAVLCDGAYENVDPFESSAAAVTAFEDGRFAELAQHNVADVLRTQAIGRVTEQYCAKSEFNVKSLTPTRNP